MDFKKEVDEVWLGLTMAESNLVAKGRTPAPSAYNCTDCYTLFVIKRAMQAYVERQRVAAE